MTSRPASAGFNAILNLNSLPVIFVLLLGFCVDTGQACMPGYEAERAKLRQYLGIEWTPNGLTKMDAQKPKPIRRPEELNCDFTSPDHCKWHNVANLDSLDYHLFRKEENTEFPAIQVRPGPSKIQVGDQMIFVGDRRREEKSAIISSWPIRCQNATGKLTFTFWIYNGARVEVLILEEDPKAKDHALRILPEKPYIDCGTVTVNTECTAEILPREQPFRIAIRAYDISHPDGSFIMIDNIFYEAQFCKVSIDFGPDFQTEPLMTADDGQSIQTASQLACHDFDKNCRWRNAGGHTHSVGGKDDNIVVWKKGITSPPETVLFNETGTYTTPTAPFAFMYIEEQHLASADEQSSDNAKNNFKMLASDPIMCQSAGGSTISFRTWASKGVEMSICTFDMDMQEKECQKISLARSPAPSVHRFEMSEKFLYAFRVDSTNSDFDNFIIIDDIEYQATMCSEAVNALDLGGEFYTAPLLSSLPNRPIHSASDLSCDFSRRGLDCLWANLEDEDRGQDSAKWEIGLGTIDNRKFESLTNRRLTPDSDLVIAKFLTRNSSAVLISETIRCFSGEGSTLSLHYWRTGDTTLNICIVRSLTYEVIDCQDVAENTAERIFVDIPSIREPIRIALRADSANGVGIVAVDNIVVQGKVCPNVAYSGKSGFSRDRSSNNYPEPTPLLSDSYAHPHAAPDENVCRLLSCNFEQGNMCLYSSKRVASSMSMFRAMNMSAYTMLWDRSRVSMLESTTFRLNTPARLHFDFAIRKGIANIHVCQDSIGRELDSCYVVNSAKKAIGESGHLVHDWVELVTTDTKVYIIAKLDFRSRKASVQISNIELTDVENHRIC